MFLDDIVASVEARAASWRRESETIKERAAHAVEARSLLKRMASARAMGVIAECKHRSPSKGWLTEHYDPVAQAMHYQTLGATAISVLTEPEFFAGSMDHLARVRQRTDLPVLCKDFVRDPIQIWQARSHGADAVLLIVRIVHDARQLGDLKQLVEALGMDALIEVHSQQELEIALSVDARLVGVNNRDLDSFHTSLEFSERMAAYLPQNVLAISESGIRTAADIERLKNFGYRGVLVGEALMRGHRVLEDMGI